MRQIISGDRQETVQNHQLKIIPLVFIISYQTDFTLQKIGSTSREYFPGWNVKLLYCYVVFILVIFLEKTCDGRAKDQLEIIRMYIP